MVILDIDMDYFQNGIHTNDNDSDQYLNDKDIQIWKQQDFIRFLENQCRLSKEIKISGRIVKHHVEAFNYWSQLIHESRLYPPFKVIHIDAHSDLGFSINIPFYKFLKYIGTENKDKQISDKIFEDIENQKYINSGNFLLCAVINNMIKEIDYVYHETLDTLDATSDVVECIEKEKSFRFKFNSEVLQQDIHLNLISKSQFVITDPIDYITVAISPPFVKKEIWELITILKNYIDLDALSL